MPYFTAVAVAVAGVAVAGCGPGPNGPLTGGSPVLSHTSNPFAGSASPDPGSPDAGSPGDGSPGDGSPNDGPATTPAAPTTPAANGGTDAAPATTPAGTCYQWNGLGDLSGIAFPLRQMASDEEIYGPGDAVMSDSMAVAAAAEALNKVWPELPSPYAMEVQNEVMVVASSPDAATPAQLDAAATNATDLASQIAGLCFSNS